MNRYMEDNSFCYFHPKEVAAVGVCHLCLNERLLILASTRGSSNTFVQGVSHKKSPINLSKIFALTSLLNRLDFKHWKPQSSDDHDDEASTSQEGSFISIKFEENGVGSREEGKVSKVSLDHCSKSCNPTMTRDQRETNKSVIEQAKPCGLLWWPKQIGHLFQIISCKRCNKVNECRRGSKVEGAKVTMKAG